MTSTVQTASPLPRARRRRLPKAKRVADDIAAQIERGLLHPGERLASFQELSESYRVSQGLVTHAIADLAKRGLVVTRQRSGCYVARTVGRESHVPAAPAGSRLGAYLSPRRKPVRQLTVYVSELLAGNLALWERVLGDFQQAHQSVGITMLSCRDGHLEDLAQTQSFDVVEAAPSILAPLGDRFITAPPLNLIGREASDLLPAVRGLAAGGSLPGIPFLITVHYLFANVSLLREVGLEATVPETWREMYRQAAEADRRLRPTGPARRGMLTGSLVDDLILAGAYRYEHGRVVWRRGAALALLEAYQDVGFEPEPTDLIPERFARGDVAYLHHCSYETLALREQAQFEWRMMPSPASADSQPVAHLTVLAASRQSPHLQDCLSLMQYLLSEPVQLAFARQHGNPPVLERAALHPEVVAGHPAGPEAYRRTLERCSPVWPQTVLDQLSRCSAVETPLLQRLVTPSQALARLEFVLETALGEKLEARPD